MISGIVRAPTNTSVSIKEDETGEVRQFNNIIPMSLQGYLREGVSGTFIFDCVQIKSIKCHILLGVVVDENEKMNALEKYQFEDKKVQAAKKYVAAFG